MSVTDELSQEVESVAIRLARANSREVDLEWSLRHGVREFYLGKTFGVPIFKTLLLAGAIYLTASLAIRGGGITLSLLMGVLVFELIRVNQRVSTLEHLSATREERKSLEGELAQLTNLTAPTSNN